MSAGTQVVVVVVLPHADVNTYRVLCEGCRTQNEARRGHGREIPRERSDGLCEYVGASLACHCLFSIPLGGTHSKIDPIRPFGLQVQLPFRPP